MYVESPTWKQEVFQLHVNTVKRLRKVPTRKTAFCRTIISSLLRNGRELFVVSKCPLLFFLSCSSIHSSLAALPDTLHAGKSNEFNWSGIHKAAPVPQASRRQGPLPGVMSGTGINPPPPPPLPNCYVCQLTAHPATTLPPHPQRTNSTGLLWLQMSNLCPACSFSTGGCVLTRESHR